MGLYEVLLCFFIYGFIGWCTEVAYAAARERKFVNRGFLNGPICPIYGVGVVSVVLLLAPFRERLLLLYVTSAIVVTALEWLTGFVLEKIFHSKWWDYSDMPLNLNGYVCLIFSLVWGVGCVIIVKWIHPLIIKGVGWLPHWLGMVLIVLFGVAVGADLYVTVTKILKLNRRLEKMEEIAAELHKISDEIGENIYKDVIEAMEKKEEVTEEFHVRKEEAAEELRERVKELRERYHDLAAMNIESGKRLLKAFPGMRSKRYKEALKDIQDYLKRK